MGNEGNKGSAFLIDGGHIALAICIRKNWNNLKVRLLFCLLFVFYFSSGVECYAQSSAMRKTAVEKKDSIMPFKSRWAIRTNAVDWLMLLPNLTAEYDLFASPYKHYTLSLGIKGNWNTSQNYKPAIVYNLLDVRTEFRQYFRTTQRNYRRPKSEKISLYKRLKEEVFTKERLQPRLWRAYYWGIYADVADYTFKFGKQGITGSAYGLGLSGGFTVPLYGYRENFIDLELGASVGMVYTKYDAFRHDVESNCYPRLPQQSKAGHIVPFPVVSDLRVAFVYRFSVSAKNKYKLIDQDKINARTERRTLKKNLRDSISDVKHKEKELKDLEKYHKQKDKEKEDKQKKLQKDSLQQVGGEIPSATEEKKKQPADSLKGKKEKKSKGGK